MLREANAAWDLRLRRSSDLRPRSLQHLDATELHCASAGVSAKPASGVHLAFMAVAWHLHARPRQLRDTNHATPSRDWPNNGKRIDYQQSALQGPFKQCAPSRRTCARAALNTRCSQLIETRISDQRRAYGLEMHMREARAGRESEDRLYLLDAWRESPAYNERQRAALAWTPLADLDPRRRSWKGRPVRSPMVCLVRH